MKLKNRLPALGARFCGAPKLLWLAAVLVAGRNRDLFANPTGMTVVAGSGSVRQSAQQLNVTVSQLAVLNWNSFNIQPGETTTFLQPSANAVVFNEISGANPSQIFGNLNANGTVILANANGFYFGPNSMISVGGSFIATTAPITPDFGSGSAWQFTGLPPLASIVNYGQIQVGPAKSLYLIAEQIDNYGGLAAPGGEVGLAAGERVLVSERPDGRGLSATVEIPQGAVNNFGQITADAGTIALQAQVVNQDGLLQADSVQNQNGEVELVASEAVNLGADSHITAAGDNSAAGSPGGTVLIQSGDSFSDTAGSRISAAGGSQGGDGGSVEVSAPNISSLNSTLDAAAQAGWTAGAFLLDPANIILGTSTANGAINVNTAFANFSSILLQASGDVTLNAGTTWNLSSSTHQTTGELTVEAGGDILFGNNSKILDANDWSVTLEAGYDFVNQAVQAGIGNIYLNGGSGLAYNGSIQLAAGAVNLMAGESILLAPPSTKRTSDTSGSVFTTGGGGIFAEALAGDIDAGTLPGGSSSLNQNGDYYFNNAGAFPNTILGGISTMNGGNVTLIAGNDIDSTPENPTGKTVNAPSASGTYGSGNVTVIAGNQITGSYTVADGVGTLLAGVAATPEQAAILQNPGADPSAGAATLSALETEVMQSQNPNGNIGGIEYAGGPNLAVKLGLIQGSWNAWAANDILLNEVYNPNGTFNSSQSYLYNYAPNAAANLWAGNGIELAGGVVGGSLPPGANQSIIYPPCLTLDAGAGGVQLDNAIILAPSSEGSLDIVTREGGNLTGPATVELGGIIMSDSGSTDHATFGTGHAATPLHENDPNPDPVALDISGGINSFSLTVPTFANIQVGGDTYDFGFSGQNVAVDQTTSINVAGNITYQPFSAANPAGTLGNQGLDLTGPGNFDISAQSIDLGVSDGIVVMPAGPILSAISPDGANINVTTSGDLAMTSSKIENASLSGGINLQVGGVLDVGGEFTAFGDADAAKGIFTFGGGNVSVTAAGNVEVDSSRIAAYDGGNVNVESVNGDVNAGGGGSGYVNVTALDLLNPQIPIAQQIPFSGILATTVVGSDATLGNISVSAPNGSIYASSSGIFQLAFNGADTQNSAIDLNAGLDVVATDSGVFGVNVAVHAGRTVTGIFVAQYTVNASAQNFGPGLLFGPMVHTEDSGGNGGAIPIQVVSENPITENGLTVPASAPAAASAPKAVAQTAADAQTATAGGGDGNDDPDPDGQQKKKIISLARRVSRVTVLLPKKD